MKIILLSFVFLLSSVSDETSEFYKKIGDNTYEVKFHEEDEPLYTKIKLEGNHVILIGKEEQIKFPVPEKVNKKDLMGFFYGYFKEDGYEESVIIRRKENTYDYRSIVLYHDTKEYERIMDDDNVPYKIIKDFIFIEDGYFSIIQKVEDDKIHFIDCYGDKYYDEKLKDQKLLRIPLGYKSVY